ncbi:hypothetical protein HID58_061285 [Brassica napus]|uniref:Uncharacterized protein n=1 Tax=Brassica napus TaxID=3708 RepID=A0ABQ7ZY87_BRANA|nr:hypothetical protein HID58_061285 [Brassica napus]
MRGNEGSSNINTTIYQSKLHKKLAFLEVKVKKSSDIKKTKDMLELNNQDSSHVIVYNIHRKITSIEKSLSHVVGVRTMVKGLNKEDLESKLFSYQRLLRIRTHLKTVSQVSEGHVSVESNKAESRKGSGQNVTGGIVVKEKRDEMMENECMYQLNDIDRFPRARQLFSLMMISQIFAPSFRYDISLNTLRDCWVVRAPGVDGNSGRYVVAASAGNTLESRFCS